MDQTGADGLVGEAVDQDEAAGLAILGVRIERDRPVQADVADADFVQFQLFAARCSSVLTLTLCFSEVIVAETVLVPIFSNKGGLAAWALHASRRWWLETDPPRRAATSAAAEHRRG